MNQTSFVYINILCFEFCIFFPPISHKPPEIHTHKSSLRLKSLHTNKKVQQDIMSFLDVKIPAVTIDSLIDDIRKQVEFGRLNTFPLATEYVRNTTPELDRLTRILQKEFKVCQNFNWLFFCLSFFVLLRSFKQKKPALQKRVKENETNIMLVRNPPSDRCLPKSPAIKSLVWWMTLTPTTVAMFFAFRRTRPVVLFGRIL